ncbi:hypothetical protein [Salinibacter sp.]|nr:hypothetical protein [Salinibacter sp.]
MPELTPEAIDAAGLLVAAACWATAFRAPPSGFHFTTHGTQTGSHNA